MGFGSTKHVKLPEQKLFGAQPERIDTNESGRVLPWFAGTRWLGVTWVGDVFGIRTSPIREKVGKKRQTVGFNYYASFAGLVCAGGTAGVDRITRIKFDDEMVWTGSVERGSTDLTSIEIEARGTIHLHWGTATQQLHPLLAASGQNHAAYRGQCYIIGDDILLGADRTTVPNIQVELERVGRPSWWVGDYLIGHDANPMTIVWEWWTDARFGLGRTDAELDTTRLIATAATLRSEGLGISPLLTGESSLKELLIKLMEHFDGYPTSNDGKLGVDLIRSSSVTVPSLSAADYTGDPSISGQQWPDTFNETRVRFVNFDKDGGDDIVKHHERANFLITGRRKGQTVDRPWVTDFDVASKIANSVGRVSGIPQCSGRLQARQSQVTGIDIGSVFSLQTRDGETLQLRCTERSEPSPDARNVEIGFETDRAWANAEFATPDQVATPTTPLFEPAQPYESKVQDAPFAFADPNLATLMFLVARGDTYSTGYDVWKASDVAGPFAAASDRRHAEIFENFSVRAKLNVAYAATTDKIDDFLGISFEVLSPDQELLEDEWDQEDGLNHKLIGFFGAAVTEIMSLYDVTKRSATTYTAKTIRSLYDTRRQSHAVNTPFWIQLRPKVDALAWTPFSDQARYYKFQTHFGNAETDLAETGAITHTENARSLLALAPANLRANGDGSHPVWTTGSPVTVEWNNTSRQRTLFGLPLNEAPATDLESLSIEVRSYDGVTLYDTLSVSPTGESTSLTNAYLVSTVNADFSLRAYGVRSGRRSLEYDEITVRKV